MKEDKIPEEKKWTHEYIEPRDGVVKSFRVALVVHTALGGYVEEEYKFEASKDGWLTICEGGHDFMIINPVAAKDLMSFIKEYIK